MERSELLKRIQKDLSGREEKTLSSRATKSARGVRRHPEDIVEQGYRTAFSLDADRVLHSRAYSRYIDKTQVFYLIRNDHITHRVLHVQLVSKIGRTIGRFLGLNEDLIEAVSLAHDIGHAPFGHDGEKFLSTLCEAHGIGAFLHNIQGVQFLDRVERGGTGWNLTLQTLDGILCHDGEVHDQYLVPRPGKTFDDLDREMEEKRRNPALALAPMTPEGCVVRVADTIAYIGRDVEDAIRLGLISRADLPADCVEVLGDSNGTMVHRLVTDVIENSRTGPHIGFSSRVSSALKKQKEFNLKRIYFHPLVKKSTRVIEELFSYLFERFLGDLVKERTDSVIYTRFLGDKSEAYTAGHRPEEIVRDFIAGMTDQYFLLQCPEDRVPPMRSIP
ncbi:MAG: HD domain-containing protein [Deltaproteobacteria bacterium]|nr:HD domain-containing protein [Deltaproteobacteria bacterium]